MEIKLKDIREEKMLQLKTLLSSLYETAKQEKNQAVLDAEVAADYYFKKKPIAAVGGASTYVDPVVQEKVDDAHSQLNDVVMSFKDCFSVQSNNINQPINTDQEAAILTMIDNTMFVGDNDLIMDSIVKDALLCGTTAVRWFSEKTESCNVQTFKDLTEIELAAKKETLLDNQDLVVTEQFISELTGDKLTSGQIVTTTTYDDVRYSHTPFNHLYVVSANQSSIARCSYVMVKNFMTKQDLHEAGYEKELIEKVSMASDYDSDVQVNNFNDPIPNWSNHSYNDKGLELVEVREIFLKTSILNKKKTDTKARLYRIIQADGVVLSVKEEDYINIAVFRPIPNISTFWGQSYACKLAPMQDVKTAIKRGFIDNIHNANHGRMTAMKGQYNKRDLMDNRPRGVVEIDVPNAIQPFPYNPLPAGIDALMMQIDVDADNVSGFSQESMGRGEDAFHSGITATQIAINHSKSDLTVKKMAKGILAGMRDLARGIYDEYRKQFPTYPAINSLSFEVETEASRRSKANDIIQAAQAMQQAGLMTPQLITSLSKEFMKNVGLGKFVTQLKTVDQLMQEAQQPNPMNELEMAARKAQIDYNNAMTQKTIQESEVEAIIKAQKVNLDEAELELKAQIESTKLNLEERKQSLAEYSVGVESQIAMINAANATTTEQVKASLSAFNITPSISNTN